MLPAYLKVNRAVVASHFAQCFAGMYGSNRWTPPRGVSVVETGEKQLDPLLPIPLRKILPNEHRAPLCERVIRTFLGISSRAELGMSLTVSRKDTPRSSFRYMIQSQLKGNRSQNPASTVRSTGSKLRQLLPSRVSMAFWSSVCVERHTKREWWSRPRRYSTHWDQSNASLQAIRNQWRLL